MKNFKRVLSLALAALMVIGGLVIAPVDAKAEGTYTKVTDVSTITDGGNFVLVAESEGAYYALGTTIDSKIDAVTVTISNNQLSGENIPVWTIASTSNGITISNGAAYLSYPGSSTSFTKNVTEVSENGTEEWDVTETGTDVFRFTADKVDTRGIFYQISGNRYGAYSTTNTSGYVADLMVFEYSGSVQAPEVKEDITLPADATPEQIINAAYQAKEDGVQLLGTWELTGVITKITDAYTAGEQYENVDVTIKVGDIENVMRCYRVVKGTNVTLDDLAGLGVGDTITVKGTISYYGDSVQYVAGSTIEAIEKAEVVVPDIELPADATPEQIIDAAYEAQATGVHLLGTWELTGVITKITDSYDGGTDFKNVDVTIKVGDIEKVMRCYRVVNGTDVTLDDLQGLAVGDTITVKGTITWYNDSVQYAAGSTIEAIEKAEVPDDDKDGSENGSEDKSEADSETKEETKLTQAEIMALAEGLKDGESLEGEYTLTGKVLEVSEVSSYGDVNVTIEVDDTNGKTIYCYGVKGDGNTEIKVGDKITVTGTIKNYKDTVEFYLPQFIPAKGDVSTLGIYMILFAGAALVTVAVVSKKRMA